MPELQQEVDNAEVSRDKTQGHSVSVEAWSAMFDEIKLRSGRKPTAEESAKLNDMTMKGQEGTNAKSEPGAGKDFLHIPSPADIFKTANGDSHTAAKKNAAN